MAKFMSCLSGWGVGTKDLLSAIKQDA
jgi:hypothetical protein